MPVITINAPIGAGTIEVGQLIAERLKLDYVDRMVFAAAAKFCLLYTSPSPRDRG